MIFKEQINRFKVLKLTLSSQHWGQTPEVHNFFNVAFRMIFEYTINESKACRSSRLEYDERVCLTSASDGVLQSVEYRLLVRRVY